MEIGGLIGLTMGVGFGLLGIFFGRRTAKKKRELDEVYEHIWQKARSLSWYVTLVSIYLLLLLALLGFMISIVKAMSIILFIHLFSWGGIGSYLSMKIYSESEADNQLYKFLLSFFLILGTVFIVITAWFL